MATIKELRLRRGVSKQEFATMAGISWRTYHRIETDENAEFQESTVYRVLIALEKLYGRKFELSEIEGIKIHQTR